MTRETDAARGGLYSLYRLDQTVEPSTVGHPAYQLSQFSRLPVTDSAIIPTDALDLFLERLEWKSPLLQDFPHLNLHLNLEQWDQLQAIAHTLQMSVDETSVPKAWCQDWINSLQDWQHEAKNPNAANGSDPKGRDHHSLDNPVAISLTPSLWVPAECDASLAGLADLITPQYCWLQPNSLAHGVKQIWKQLFQASMLYIWDRSDFPFEHLKLAIILQPLPAARASGWFHLTSEQLLIQAIPGLHVGLLLGDVTPDLFQINRRTAQINRQTHQHPHTYELISQSSHEALVSLQPRPKMEQNNPALCDLEIETFISLANQLPEQTEDLSIRWSLVPQGKSYRLQIHEVADCDLPSDIFRIQESGEESVDPLIVAQGLSATPGCAIASAFVTQTLQAQPPESVANTILVVPHCQPSDLPWLQQAAGLICGTGGLTSHGAILARELGLPAIVGFSGAITTIQTGQWIKLDGDQGAIYQLHSPQEKSDQPYPAVGEPNRSLNKQSLKTQVWVTLSQIQAANNASQLPVDGVGLLRSEWLLLDLLQGQHPLQWMQQGKQAVLTEHLVDHLQRFLKAFAPRPVFYRTLDGSTRELAGLKGGEIEPVEANPALGFRGVARYQADPRLFDCELMALTALQQQGWDNLRLLLPFVRSVEEFEWCCDLISSAGLFQSPTFQVWIMAEVPSILFLLEDYVKAGAQGIAIGSNDLTQLILGIDRDQPLLDQSLNASHPAVMAAISQLIQTAQELEIPCSFCGQVQQPHVIKKLVEWGITAISTDVQAVTQARQIIAEAEQELFFTSPHQ